MVQACSLKLSRDLGIHHSYGCNGYRTSMMGKGRLNFAHINLSSYTLDAWSLVLNGLHRPMKAVSSRYDVFVCRSVLIPGGGNHMPFLKSTGVVLSRSYDALRGIPHVLQLIPAVGVIAFALWGLGPIMRFCRILVLRKNDNTWNKSGTHYLMTSYLRPLLLWIGAALICRALDPVILRTEASQAVKQHVLYLVRSVSTVLASAYCLSRLIQQVQKRNDSCDAANMGFSFAWKAIYYGVWVAAVSLSMELLGFSTQNWMTAGGLGTVLITLAGREIFENFLSSVMLHATRPFVASEWIQTNIGGYEVSGVVERVGWWSPTVVRGDDREAVHIPNHKFNSSVVRNLSQKTHWRIKTHLAVSHLDYNKINNIVADMRKVISKNPQVEQRMLHKRVFFENIDPENQSLMILVSCFVKTPRIEEYFCVKEAILLDLLRVISHHQARLATPIRTVQKVYSEADMEGIPFAETIFSRSRSAAKRPLLLSEPAYKVNGDNKSKVSKDETASTSDSKVGGSTLTIDPTVDDRVTASSVDALKETIVLNSEPSGKVSKKPEVQTQSNQDDEKNAASTAVARPPLEENIVLGVALEGSKRTLPINDGDEVSPTVTDKDSKEFSSRRNGSAVGKDKKDGPMSAVPSGSD